MDIVEFATSAGYITGLILGVSIWLIPILFIILLIKVWRMSKDVKEIKIMLEERELNGSAPSVR